MRTVLESDTDSLVWALMATGKSTSAIKAAKDTGEPITVLTARTDLYDDYVERCIDAGLSYEVIPSLHRTCPTASENEDGEVDDMARSMRRIYNMGVPSKVIHDRAPEIFDHSLDCNEWGKCPYQRKMLGLNTDVDVLIGHYTHGHVPKVTENRTVLVDEFPETAYITELDAATLSRSVSGWLQERSGFPYDDKDGLIEGRHNDERRADAFEWFDQNGVEPDHDGAVESRQRHVEAPYAVLALLNGENLGNGWEHSEVWGRTVAYDRDDGSMHLLNPPAFEGANSVVALDGTPTQELWKLALGRSFDVRELMDRKERRGYISDTLGLKLYQTTESRYPYASGNLYDPADDLPLFRAANKAHDHAPGLISSYQMMGGEGRENAKQPTYDSVGALEWIGAHEHRENVIGSNQMKSKRLGIVTGHNHLGDGFIQKWCALAGEPAPSPERNGQPVPYEVYGEFGEKVARHMIQNQTLQEVMRFGRDGGGAVVYVHTSTLPEWVPLAGRGEVINSRSNGRKAVLAAISDTEQARFTTADIAEHTSISKRQIRTHLSNLESRGMLTKKWSGGQNVYEDTGASSINPESRVDLRHVWADETPELPDWISADTSEASPVVSTIHEDLLAAETGAIHPSGW